MAIMEKVPFRQTVHLRNALKAGVSNEQAN